MTFDADSYISFTDVCLLTKLSRTRLLTNAMNIPLHLQNSIIDSKYIELLKYACGIVPVCQTLSPFVEMLTDYRDKLVLERIVDVLAQISQNISNIDESKIDKEYIHSETFLREMLYVLQFAKDEENNERRRRFAEFLTSGCSKEHVKDTYKRILFQYLNQIDEIDICLLKNATEILDDGKLPHNVLTSWNISNPQNKITDEDIEIHISYLDHIGLLEPVDLETFKSFMNRRGNISIGRLKPDDFDVSMLKKYGFYKKTSIGKHLLKYIS